MKYIVLSVIEKDGSTGKAMTSQTVEVNSESAAEQAASEIKRTMSSFDRVRVSYFPKGRATKEEILLLLVQANPLASITELNQKADEIIKCLKN